MGDVIDVYGKKLLGEEGLEKVRDMAVVKPLTLSQVDYLDEYISFES